MRDQRREKLLLLHRGRQLPVLPQQSGSALLLFSLRAGLIMLNGSRWQEKQREEMNVDRLLMGICIPALTEAHAKFQHKCFFDHFGSPLKVKTIQHSQTDTAPSELCCCASQSQPMTSLAQHGLDLLTSFEEEHRDVTSAREASWEPWEGHEHSLDKVVRQRGDSFCNCMALLAAWMLTFRCSSTIQKVTITASLWLCHC